MYNINSLFTDDFSFGVASLKPIMFHILPGLKQVTINQSSSSQFKSGVSRQEQVVIMKLVEEM